MSVLRRKAWSPYVAGALIGLLAWFSFATANEALGVSTTFVRAAGLVEHLIVPGHVAANEYYQSKGVAVDWQMMLVIGIALGAALSALLSGDREEAGVPALWKQRFGDSTLKRNVGAFVGGALVLFGARLAGGCTSGHGLSGAMQLAFSGWLFMIVLFAVGIVAAHAIYGKEAGHV